MPRHNLVHPAAHLPNVTSPPAETDPHPNLFPHPPNPTPPFPLKLKSASGLRSVPDPEAGASLRYDPEREAQSLLSAHCVDARSVDARTLTVDARTVNNAVDARAVNISNANSGVEPAVTRSHGKRHRAGACGGHGGTSLLWSW